LISSLSLVLQAPFQLDNKAGNPFNPGHLRLALGPWLSLSRTRRALATLRELRIVRSALLWVAQNFVSLVEALDEVIPGFLVQVGMMQAGKAAIGAFDLL